MTDHSEWGPSRASAYTACLDYINANKGLPDHQLMVAAEGTFAHMISDACLKQGLSPYDFVGRHETVNNFDFTWTVDDAALLNWGITRIRTIEGEFYGEQRVDVSDWTTENTFGTLDRTVIGEGYVYLNDLKWGRGISVNPVRNLQMTLYALGLWKANAGFLGRDCRFVLEVDQPRLKGGGGVWSTNLEELEEIGAWIKQQVAKGLEPNPSRVAGHVQCAFCRRKRAPKGCHVYDNYLKKIVTGLPAPSSLSLQERLNILENDDMIIRWLDVMRAMTVEEGLQGTKLPGHKLVESKRGRSDYVSYEIAEAALVNILGEKSYNKKLISPSVASKVLGKALYREKIEPLVVKGSTHPVLVPEGDSREPIVLQLDDYLEEGEY